MSDEHEQKMKAVKQAKDRMQEQRQEEKGLFIVHTGAGKGKTTAALGMVLRCLGHGFRVGVVQFVKGPLETAEARLLPEQFPDRLDWFRMGEGFTWETQDRERDRRAAEEAWEQSETLLTDPAYDFVLLDELNIVLSDDLLDPEAVLETIRNRPEGQHVTVTGRRAPDLLVGAGDLVTEMRPIRHHYKDQGVKAQAGIEY